MDMAAAALVRAAEGALAEGAAGTVRITASEMMGAEVLPAILAEIQREHPRIVLELALTNRAENLLRRDADIAVRMLRPAQAALLAQRLGLVRLGLYAHEDYLARHGTPIDLADLRRFHIIGFDRDEVSARAIASADLPIDRSIFSFRSDSDLAQAAAIRAALGIGVMQDGIARAWPRLRPVLPGLLRFELDVWLALHEDQRGNPAVAAVRAGLARGLTVWLDKDNNP
jgi:DNA-binding transcriptional LysR family regulator